MMSKPELTLVESGGKSLNRANRDLKASASERVDLFEGGKIMPPDPNRWIYDHSKLERCSFYRVSR
jgi:hypothetical protein